MINSPLANTLPKINDRIRILSWNIHDIKSKTEDLKTENLEFKNMISNHLVFALQETKRKVNVPDYMCFNKLRKGSRSGGLCIGIHKSLANRVKEVKVCSQDIQAVSITTASDCSEEMLTIVNVYDSPEDSSYKKI